MPNLTSNVGDGSDNKPHDVALVELLLHIVKNPKTHKRFFASNYDSKFTKATKDAIVAFQKEFNLAAAAPTPPPPPKPGATTPSSPPPPPPASATTPATADTLGLVKPGSATFQKMVDEAAAVDASFKLLRVLPETKVAYLEMTQAEFDERLKSVTDSELESGFKTKVTALVRKMYADHKIALAGWGKLSYRRSFANQHKLFLKGPTTTEAGPGESNHQFGQALDVGYVGLRLVRPNGTILKIINENQFDKSVLSWQIAALYKARNAIWEKAPQGTGTLFRIRMHGGDNDPNHFQNFNQFSSLYPDPTVDIRVSLAAFLSGISGFNWEKKHGGHYACDLGTGSTPVDVGTADQIWTGHASLTKHQYVRLLNEARHKNGQAPLHDGDVSQATFQTAFNQLKATFEEGESRWSEWQPRDSNGNSI